MAKCERCGLGMLSEWPHAPSKCTEALRSRVTELEADLAAWLDWAVGVASEEFGRPALIPDDSEARGLVSRVLLGRDGAVQAALSRTIEQAATIKDYAAALRICTDALLDLGATDVLSSLEPYIGTPLNPKR